MEVNLENILSRDCSSLSRDDLESSSIRRRRPCCGCPGRSRVKAGAGTGGGPRRGPGAAAGGAGGRAGGCGGGGARRAAAAGTRRSAPARGPRGAAAAAAAAAVAAAAAAPAAPARTRWQPGSGSFRPLCPPRPAGGAAAARGGPDRACPPSRGAAGRGGGGTGAGGAGGADPDPDPRGAPAPASSAWEDSAAQLRVCRGTTRPICRGASSRGCAGHSSEVSPLRADLGDWILFIYS
ncbi:alanine and glycine-rich protein-like isoform X2 [Vulpes lagopus]|uniref:alanine and glycine-rich protein-like isoform X2 n=1 Tax=Vulpes lagopus TaxID=494514 RepID=UPI001BC8DD41|nr:alanine and glycine-rich protein-like isoform X2 [Vulpes lagopus]